MRLLKKIIKLIRATYVLGPISLRNRILVGAKFSFLKNQGTWSFGRNISFGNNCGVALVQSNHLVPELVIGDNVSFQDRVKINVAEKVEIGSGSIVSWDVDILDTDFHSIIRCDGSDSVKIKPVKIGNNCWIGAKATILKGVCIGNGSVIAAGSIVTKSFPEYSLIAGNPAVLIKKIEGWRI